MDTVSQERLQRILKTPVHMIPLEDKRFLHSRRDYLTRSQREDFSPIIDEVTELNRRFEEENGSSEVRPSVPEQSHKVRKVRVAKQPSQDRDVRLNLNVPAKSEKQIAAEKAMAEAKRLQEEAEREAAKGSSEQDEEGDDGVGASGEQTQGSDVIECLDPDCTHDSVSCPIFKAEHPEA